MPTRSRSDAIEKALRCPVCLDAMDDDAVLTPCGHRFCEPCIKEALRVCKQECPTCRKPIASHRLLHRCSADTLALQPKVQPRLQLDDHGQSEELSAAVVVADDDWCCPVCTLANAQSLERCAACNARRPTAKLCHGGYAEAPVEKRQRLDVTPPAALTPVVSGQRVRGKFQGADGGANWYCGTVTAVHGNGNVDIKYDDGDFESAVAPRFVRALKEQSLPMAVAAPYAATALVELDKTHAAWPQREDARLSSDSTRAAEPAATARARRVAGEGSAATPPPPPATAPLQAPLHVASTQPLILAPHDRRRLPSRTGYLNVHPTTSSTLPFCTKVLTVDGKHVELGRFATALEAAEAYTAHHHTHGGARVPRPPPVSLASVEATAAAEGLQLLRSARGYTGYKWVYRKCEPHGGHRKTFDASVNGTFLRGSCATAHEAALEVARYLGPAAVAQIAAEEETEAARLGEVALSREEVLRQAAAEGLSLLPASSSATGFRGVGKRVAEPRTGHRDYTANAMSKYLGTFFSAEEAALAVARYLGVERITQRQKTGHQMLSAAQALELAEAEGITLELAPPGPAPGRRSNTSNVYKGVSSSARACCKARPYRATHRVGSESKFLGNFATAEQAALEIARCDRGA